jgi:anti-sigma B factor antagonist
MSEADDDFPFTELPPPSRSVPLFLSVREEPGVTVVAVSGELDLLTAPKLMAELDDIVGRRTGDAVVDLSETAFMDSFGIHVLVSAHNRLARQSRKFAVICGPSPVRRTLELTNLTEALSVADSYDEYERRRSEG